MTRRSVELLGADNSLIERKILDRPEPMETTTRIVLRTGSDEDSIVDHPGQPAAARARPVTLALIS